MRYFFVGIICFGLFPADAQSIQYDPKKVILKEQLADLEESALSCFDESFRAMLQQGVRDRALILRFAYPICGNTFRDFLIAHGMPPKKATDYIVKEANEELDRVVADGQ
jgi:hypothetical protein